MTTKFAHPTESRTTRLLPSYLTGAATAAMFAFIAGAWAENAGWFADPETAIPHHDETAEAVSVHDQTLHDTAFETAKGVPSSAVENPERVLTNLTVYSDGRDIGHIRSVTLDERGQATRIEIAFNDGTNGAWVDASAIAYDSAHRRAVTSLDPGEMKALEHVRLR